MRVKDLQPSYPVQPGRDGRTRVEDTRLEGTKVEGTRIQGSSDVVPTVLLTGRPSEAVDREPTVVLSTLRRVNDIDATTHRRTSVDSTAATVVQRRPMTRPCRAGYAPTCQMSCCAATSRCTT